MNCLGRVVNALRRAALATPNPATGQSANAKVTSGPAQNTAKPSSANGETILTPDRLRARALMQNNRDKQAVAAYVQLHQTLIRGR